MQDFHGGTTMSFLNQLVPPDFTVIFSWDVGTGFFPEGSLNKNGPKINKRGQVIYNL